MVEEHQLSLEENSKLFIALVKERFHGMTSETIDIFKHLLIKSAEQSETIYRAILFSEVKTLFTKHHDLIEKFRYFLDYNRTSESNGEEENNIYCRSTPDKKSVQMVLSNSAEFINRVKRILNDDDKFESFITTIIGFQQHMDIKRVEREAFFLFKEHPELEIEFCEFLAEANAGRTVHDMVAAKKHKWEEAKGHLERYKKRQKKQELSEHEFEMFKREDDLFKTNLAYVSMLRTKEAAERLIVGNSGTNPDKEIWIVSYFRSLDLTFMKEELKEKPLLCEETMMCEMAILESEEIVRCLEKEIDILTRNWSEEKKIQAEANRKKDLQIPMFDWHAAQ